MPRPTGPYGGLAEGVLRPTRPTGYPLLQRNRQPAEVRVGYQPDCPAGQFQHRALLVGQHDRVRRR